MTIISTGSGIFHASISNFRRPLDTVDLEELPYSRERPGAPHPWLSCEGHADVWEMLSVNSYLSTILDRQGLLTATPIDLRTKKPEHFTPQLPQGFWYKLNKKDSQDRWDVPNCCNEELRATRS